MPVAFRSNLDSLRANTQLNKISAELSTTFARLSSGVRINSASDDPAGLALADGLRADARLASVAVRNANDGISSVAIADAALAEIGNILTRMAELAEQSANGTYSNTQRSALSAEFIALGSEIERIAKTTQFNDINLLSNSSNLTLQVGIGGTSNDQITISSVLGTLTSLGLSGGSGALSFSIIDTTVANSQAASYHALSAVDAALSSITMRRGIVGAAESRLNSAINFMTLARENFIAAEARIRDIDVAQEVANMVRLQVLQQSATAVLAQANLQPKNVLELLG